MLHYLPLDVITIIFGYTNKIIDKRNFIRSSKYINNLTKSIFNEYMNTFSFEYNKIKHNENHRYIFELCHDGYQDHIPKKLLKKGNEDIVNIMIQFKLLDYVTLVIGKCITSNNVKYAIDYFDDDIMKFIKCNDNNGYMYKFINNAIINNNLNFMKWFYKIHTKSNVDMYTMAIYGHLEMLIMFEIITRDHYKNEIYTMAGFFGHIHILKYLDDNNYKHDENVIKFISLTNNVDTIEYMNNKGYKFVYDKLNDYYYDKLKNLLYDNVYTFENIYTTDYELCRNYAKKDDLKMVQWLISKSFMHDDSVFYNFMMNNNIDGMQYWINNKFPIATNVMESAAKVCKFDVFKCLYDNGYLVNDRICMLLFNNKQYETIKWIKGNCSYYDISHYYDKVI